MTAYARDRAIALLMLLGGLRAGEVRALRLAEVDQGLRRVGSPARAVGSGWSRLTPRSSPSSPPICAPSGRPDAAPRSASWCCAAPPRAVRLPSRGPWAPTWLRLWDQAIGHSPPAAA